MGGSNGKRQPRKDQRPSTRICRTGEPIDNRVPPPKRLPQDPEITLKRPTIALALRAEGHTIKEIADLMGIKPGTVSWYLQEARKEARLQDDTVARLAHGIIPLSLDAVHDALLPDQSIDTRLKAAIPALEGRGVFVHHQAAKFDGAAPPDRTLRVIVETAPPRLGAPAEVLEGSVVGVPRALTAGLEPDEP